MARNVTTETIRSDSNPHTTYEVTLYDGKAAYCSCPHGRKFNRKTPCKHMRRAEFTPLFRVAKRSIKESKGLSEEAFLAFFRKAAKESGVDGAIQRVINAANLTPQKPSDEPSDAEIEGLTFEATCNRCHGTGELPCYRHVEGGICFKCQGACTVRLPLTEATPAIRKMVVRLHKEALAKAAQEDSEEYGEEPDWLEEWDRNHPDPADNEPIW